MPSTEKHSLKSRLCKYMLWTSDKSVDLADRLCPPLGENSVIQMFVSQDCTCEDSTDGRCHPATAVPISPSTRSCSQACFRKGCVCACTVVSDSLYLTLCDPMDCSQSGSSVHAVLQARILEWVVMPSSRQSY